MRCTPYAQNEPISIGSSAKFSRIDFVQSPKGKRSEIVQLAVKKALEKIIIISLLLYWAMLPVVIG